MKTDREAMGSSVYIGLSYIWLNTIFGDKVINFLIANSSPASSYFIPYNYT